MASPQAAQRSGGSDAPTASELASLVAVLRREKALQDDELVVRTQTVVSMANALLLARTDAAASRSALAVERARRQAAETATAAAAAATAATATAAAHAPPVDSDAISEMKAELALLRAGKAESDATMAEWRGKVKEALKDSRRKEQAQQQREIALRTELKELQELHDRAAFEVAALRLRADRPREAKEAQTEADVTGLPPPAGAAAATSVATAGAFCSDASGGGFGDWAGGAGGSGDGRRGAGDGAVPLRVRSLSRAGAEARRLMSRRSSSAAPPEGLNTSLSNGAANTSAAAAGAVAGGGTGVAVALAPRFVASPETAGAAGGGAATAAAAGSALRDGSVAPNSAFAGGSPWASPAPQPPGGHAVTPGSALAIASAASADGPGNEPREPLIVTVHFGTTEGWTLDTKHRVSPGMTVGELVTACCAMINARFSQALEPRQMCLKLQHERAKRPVTLREEREVCSFTLFDRCQREAVPIVLRLGHKEKQPAHVQWFLAGSPSPVR